MICCSKQTTTYMTIQADNCYDSVAALRNTTIQEAAKNIAAWFENDERDVPVGLVEHFKEDYSLLLESISTSENSTAKEREVFLKTAGKHFLETFKAEVQPAIDHYPNIIVTNVFIIVELVAGIIQRTINTNCFD